MLELINVSRRVGAEDHIIDVSLELQRGSINVLLGPTLAGKTSLMRLMAGLDAPTSGKVVMDGKDVTGVPVRRRNVAMVYQQFINYPTLTVYENIASPLRVQGVARDEIETRVRNAAKLLKLEPYLNRTPLQLSGGQQQRTAIARALAARPRLVLADEPTGNLDEAAAEAVLGAMLELVAETGAALLMVTHSAHHAARMGRRLHLRAGRIA